MSGHTDSLAEADNALPSPDLRATVRGEQLFVTDWGSQLAGPASLRARSDSDGDGPAPAIVDLAALGDEREELMVMHYEDRHDLGEIEQVIVRWAGQVGYRRVWLAESVVDVDFPESGTPSARFRCPTCFAELSGDGADFWLLVRKARMFPPFCPICGVEAPQWEVSLGQDSSSHGLDSDSNGGPEMSVLESPTGDIRHVDRREDVDAILSWILDPERKQPVVALTARQGGDSIAISPDEVAHRSQGSASVLCLGSASVIRALENLQAAEQDPAKGIVVPFHGAAVVWWPSREALGSKLSSKLVLDKTGVYGPEYLDEIEEILRAGPGTTEVRRPGGADSDRLKQERERRKASDREARDLREENRGLKSDLADSNRKLAEQRKENRRLREALAEPGPEQGSTESPFRADVDAFWAEESQQTQRSLRAYSVGPKFEASVRACERATREQVVRTVVHLLCGFDEQVSKHPLRVGSGPNDAQRLRGPDRAKAYRCSVKDKTPGAPRLHYWLTPSGQIELSLVVTHDSMKIVE